MPIVWLPAAVQDIIHIRTYISDNDPVSARNVAQRIDQSVSNLAKMPNMGRPGRLLGTRELVVSGTPYLAVYRVQNSRVEILRVLHGRQPFPDNDTI
ncbi:Toxin RelE2 [Acaryochloris thomasi RCC1774]|uniref:Toxin RelE2 n=1 Tax=Acaryochloris thomasi RCC1774 TaxID=1764569 RepID=A0A2W1JQ54_9CYAN|nr:type II toxin-antitoxin system RelE/ParE family toxin [Acaryochloris thomasi]PZD75478.1 Toxin RelE2 [Acaryochloris thomasi RCC1774]